MEESVLLAVAQPFQVAAGRARVEAETRAAERQHAPPRPSLLQSLVVFFDEELVPLLDRTHSQEALGAALSRMEPRYLHFRRTLLEVVARDATGEAAGAAAQGLNDVQALHASSELVEEVFGKWGAKLALQLRLVTRLGQSFMQFVDSLDEETAWMLFDRAVRVDLLVTLSTIALSEERRLEEDTRRAIVLELEAELRRWSRMTAIYRERAREASPRPLWPELTDEQIRERQSFAERGIASWASSLETETGGSLAHGPRNSPDSQG